MPQIPLAHYTPTESKPTGVRANPGMYDAVGNAGERIGGAMQQIGNTMSQFALKKQEAVNASTLADADRQMNEAAVLFQDKMRASQNEFKTWDKSWEKQVQSTEKEIAKLDVAPSIKGRMETMLKDWKSKGGLMVRQAQTMREIEVAASKTVLAADAAVKMLDGEKAKQIIDEGVRTGVIAAEKGAEYLAKIPNQIAYTKAAGEVINSPMLAEESLNEKNADGTYKNYPELEQTQRYTLQSHAQVVANRLREEFNQNVIQRAQNGETLTKEEINDAVAKKLWKPTQARSYEKAYLTDHKATPADIVEISTMINGFDPMWSDQKKAEYRLAVSTRIATAGLPTQTQQEAMQLLNEKTAKNSVTASPVAQEAFRQIEDAESQGVYGTYKIQRPGKADVTDPVKYQEVQMKKAKIQTALTDFLRKNPNATYADVQVFLQGEQAKFVVVNLTTKLRAIATVDAREKAIEKRKENLK